MSYTIDRILKDLSFDDVVERVRAALSREGFGVLTEINVKETMKKKLDKGVPDYLILGACNPGMAFEAMKIEPRVGAMLPCNVIMRDTGDGSIEVSAIDPLASMTAIENVELKAVATHVREMMEKVVSNA